MKFFKTRVLLWPVLLIIVVFVGAAVAAASFGALNALALGSLFGTSSKEKNAQVVRSIERAEEVVLVKLAIEGIADKKTTATIGDFDIPWTTRALYLRYSFDAKLGIDGRAVTIRETGEDSWTISIPAFTFIGAEDETAEIAVETADGLAFTPEIDDQEMRNDLLDDEAKATYIEDNTELLRDQAKSFYTRIIHAVDPDAELRFEFSAQPASEQN